MSASTAALWPGTAFHELQQPFLELEQQFYRPEQQVYELEQQFYGLEEQCRVLEQQFSWPEETAKTIPWQSDRLQVPPDAHGSNQKQENTLFTF